MPRAQPGQRFGGRLKGSKSAAQTALEEMLIKKMGKDYIPAPLSLAYYSVGMDPSTRKPDADITHDLRVRSTEKLAALTYPSLKSVEHKGDGGGAIQIVINKPPLPDE